MKIIGYFILHSVSLLPTVASDTTTSTKKRRMGDQLGRNQWNITMSQKINKIKLQTLKVGSITRPILKGKRVSTKNSILGNLGQCFNI